MGEYKFLDDLAKFGNNTIGIMTGFQRQVRKWTAEQTENLVKGMDLVTRDQVETYKVVAEAAQEKIQALEERLKELEKKLADGKKKDKAAK
jgi:BMFP domain-containing protein YqiC